MDAVKLTVSAEQLKMFQELFDFPSRDAINRLENFSTLIGLKNFYLFFISDTRNENYSPVKM